MKRLNYLLTAGAFLVIVTTTSCSKSDDGCHECHIAFMNASGQEVEVEIGEFCGTALETVEAPGYTHTLTEDVVVGNETVPAGDYSEIHCEEHADH